MGRKFPECEPQKKRPPEAGRKTKKREKERGKKEEEERRRFCTNYLGSKESNGYKVSPFNPSSSTTKAETVKPMERLSFF